MSHTEHPIVISADGHAGADVLGYKPYLATEFHDEFDAWAASYTDPWGVIDQATDEDNRIGPASFASSVNWDSAKRLRLLENEGIAGEVLFPNTAPPFFPAGAISAHVPGSPQEYERRYAGLQAHNRWLADFCADTPGRRAGIAQIFLTDVERAVREVRWAKEHGLKGVLLPSDHMLQLSNLYYPKYEPFWAACEELEMPLHRHGVVPSEAASAEVGDAAPLIGFSEIQFFIHRPITHLILSGVFERHPNLKLVLTENGSAKTIPLVKGLDRLVQQARADDTVMGIFGSAAARRLSRLPSEYLRSNIYHGSFFVSGDIEQRYEVGADRMMWGADFPHHEGTHPFSREAMRLNFSSLPDDEIRMMVSTTAMDVYGFDADALQPVADRIGPTLTEIKSPISIADIAVDKRTHCPTFIEAAMAG
jgi:predicted TIM-barrel fold metal-dependent hydrolase